MFQEYKSFIKQLRNRNENTERQTELEMGFLRRELSFYTKSKMNKNQENTVKDGTKENKQFQIVILRRDCKCFRKEINKLTHELINTNPTGKSAKESIKTQESKSKSNKKHDNTSVDLETVCGLIEKDQLLKYYV